MSKKLKITLISLGILLICGMCVYLGTTHGDRSEEEKTEEVVQDEDREVQTIESVLSTLASEGYEKTEEGYRLSEFADDVRSERVVNAIGDQLDVVLKYDYGEKNAEMKKFFRKQGEAVYVMVSGFLARLASRANAEYATMHYTIYVGGDMVREGDMDLQEAMGYQDLAGD